MHWSDFRAWRQELRFAVPIIALVTYLFYSWFAILNRYLIFLYYHDMGPGFDTTPFGRVTASRYWMAGLVAAGAVMVLYVVANLVLGRLVRAYRAPVWWRVWLLCAVALAIVIPAMVMTVNTPVLPLQNALQVTAVLLLGLAPAVALGRLAADHPLRYAMLMVDGLALACLLLALRTVESYGRWLARGYTSTIYMSGVVVAAGLVLLTFMTALYYLWRRAEIPQTAPWLVASLNIYYLFLPLCHYLFFSSDEVTWTDPKYFAYISDADNFFATGVPVQIGVWLAVTLIALSVTRLRTWLRRRRMASRTAALSRGSLG